MRTVHVVMPDWVDDPGRPSGGSTYDRRACEGLRALGWDVREWQVAGGRPDAGSGAADGVCGALAGMPDDALVLLDGILASPVPESLAAESARLRQVVLVHLPIGVEAPAGAPEAGHPARVREARSLRSARAVIVTSVWTRDWLLDAYTLPPTRVVVVPPGTDRADPAVASAAGGRLLCVGAVTPVKGQDLLVDALAAIADLEWTCTFVGSTLADPDFARSVRDRAGSAGIGARVRFTGPLVGPALSTRFARSDLVVVASRTETYGMVVTEALARGIPVIAPAVGGLPEALGRAPGGGRPGALVPPSDVDGLAAAIREWLTDEAVRVRLRRAARARRPRLGGWAATAASLSAVLEEVAA